MQGDEHPDATIRMVRTTITLADDVARSIERVRRERSIGLSEAVNELIRAGLTGRPSEEPFEQRTAPLGIRIDVTDTWDAIESLDGPTTR